MSIHYRVELNPLTKPASYKLRFIPQGIAGNEELAAAMADDTGLSVEQTRACLQSMVKNVREFLSSGLQVSLEDAFTFRPSLHGRLPTPDAPLPPKDKVVGMNISASQNFIDAMLDGTSLVREPWVEKMPSIQSALDTKTGLNNVLNPEGVLRITGSNLFFDWEDPDCSCVIAGTESGSEAQTQFASITNTEVVLVPHIPVQSNLWNNEYTVSITTQYTEHGSVRTGIYGHKLRTPLNVPGLTLPIPPETGILTGSAATPYVGINAGSLTADERIRIQVEYNVQDDLLAFRLIDMEDGGAEGNMVPINGPGEFILHGFAGSAVSTIEITVDEYDPLKTMVINDYDGRLVDILDVKML